MKFASSVLTWLALPVALAASLLLPLAAQADDKTAASAAEPQATIVLVADNPADAQATLEDLQKRLDAVDQHLKTIDETQLSPIAIMLPGITSNVPVAYGAPKGSIAFGVGYQERTRYSQKSDGAVGVVFGLGDPKKLGIDVQVAALDLSRFFQRDTLSLKFHRLLPNDYMVAVGVENLIVRGSTDGGRSIYGVVSKLVRLKESSRQPFSRLFLSGGLGNGRFRSENNVLNDTGSVNVFGSAALNLGQQSTVFTEWTGQALNVGLSIVPFKKIPLVITPALADVAGPAGDGTRFTLGVGYIIKN